jgi:hypothetical protein
MGTCIGHDGWTVISELTHSEALVFIVHTPTPWQAATLLAVEGYAEQALVTPDKLGLLPLHHAARCGGPLVQMLLGESIRQLAFLQTHLSRK